MAKTRPEDEWLDYERAVKYLHDRLPGGFTRRSLERVKSHREITAIKNRNKVFFHKDELDRYIHTKTGAYKTGAA
jgi:hypothetical protein